ncbi:MAG: aminoglycoside phosphotransferase family protein [Calditrichae bacterium]|nr:aminoglycoside phosphotransferase family protein [Calditrichia bacterium]
MKPFNPKWNNLAHAAAAKLIANQLPEFDAAQLEPAGEGDFCLAFRCSEKIIRVARHAEAAAAIERETCVLRKIAAELPLPVPQLSIYTPETCPPFTMHNEIVGDVLTREIWERLPAVSQEKAVADLANFLKALHSIPVEIADDCELPQLDAVTVAANLSAAAAKISHLLDPQSRLLLAETLERWANPPNPEKRQSLIHCDIAPGHLLFDPQSGHLTGVIDFGDIAIGNTARDFIYIYEDFGESILELVLNYYAGKNAPEMMTEIRKWYLLEAISWVIDKFESQDRVELAHGIAEIERELTILKTSLDD